MAGGQGTGSPDEIAARLSPPGSDGLEREPITGIQRAQILAAMVQVVGECGYSGASLTSVCARAKVSRRTFYGVFDSLEDCFLAVLDEGARHAGRLISQAFAGEQRWCDGVRAALAALLSFFDSEPVLAHVLLVEAAAAGARARERRERHILSLTWLIEDRWGAPEHGHAHPLVTAGVMGSLLAILNTQLVTGRREPLLALLGPLMGLVTAPYLDRRLVTREIERADAHARELLARRDQPAVGSAEHGARVPDLLLNPRAHRARACLLYLLEHSGASNTQIARAAGIGHHTQISKLLARMAAVGLLTKRAGNPGGPNAWSLTSHGVEVSHALSREQSNDLDSPQDLTHICPISTEPSKRLYG
jgi:AcrR family transcriptional regulator